MIYKTIMEATNFLKMINQIYLDIQIRRKKTRDLMIFILKQPDQLLLLQHPLLINTKIYIILLLNNKYNSKLIKNMLKDNNR